MRNLWVVPASVLLATFAPLGLFVPAQEPVRPSIILDAIPLDLDRPSRTRVGKLEWLGGWIMRGDDTRFGGLSALHVADGKVIALSDLGYIFEFPVPAGEGRLPLRVVPLKDGQHPWRRKKDRDTESLAVFGGTAWIGFEIRPAIWRYRLGDWKGLGGLTPERMKEWPGNGGAEAMLRLADGRFLVFSEEEDAGGGTTEVLLFGGDPTAPGAKPARLRYRPPEGYLVTDVAQLPDGRLLLLNRGYGVPVGFLAKLTVARLPAPRPDAVIEGKEVATLQPPLAVDNMEGLSITSEGGRTIVWLVSDDNLIPLQRSLLLKFALRD